MLGRYAAALDDAPYYLEHLLEGERELLLSSSSGALLQQVLFRGLQVFRAHPAATQHSLEDILEVCAAVGEQSGDGGIEAKVQMYLRLLREELAEWETAYGIGGTSDLSLNDRTFTQG